MTDRRTANPEAYDYYLKGLQLLASNNPKPVEAVRTQPQLKPEGERQQPFKPAVANRAPKATVLPGSNFDAFHPLETFERRLC